MSTFYRTTDLRILHRAAAFCLGLLGLCLSGISLTAEEPTLDPAQPYTAKATGRVTHQVEMRIVITPPAGTEQLKVWVPLPPSDEAQTVEDRHLETFPRQVEPTFHTEPVYGNRFAHFVFDQPQGAQIITHRFRATLHDLRWQLDPETVRSVEMWPDSFDPYLQPQVIRDERRLQAALAGALAQEKHPTAGLLSAMRWIDQNVIYDHGRASLAADPNRALVDRAGHCSDFHSLCATMGRRLGYPTRLTYGLSMHEKPSPSHCKLEAYLPPYGWVSFDLSETQKLVGKIAQDDSLTDEEKEQWTTAARARLERGFRENSWLLVTQGTDYELSPPAAQGKVPVVRTIYAEADGQALPEPDPANPEVETFAWMTALKVTSDKPIAKPFSDIETLK